MALPLTLCLTNLKKETQLMDIYSILAIKPHNSHYLNRYITFIGQCQQKNVDYEGPIENHHICPRAKDMFPEYDCFRKNPWNKASLTPRQHFIAHLILWKAYPKIYSCLDAIWGMKCRRKAFMNSRIYEKLRKDALDLISSRMKGNITVKDPKDPDRGYFQVSADDPDYVSGKYVSYMKGRAIVKDINDPDRGYFSVSVDDPDYLSGKYVVKNKDMVLVYEDCDPDILFYVSKIDDEYLAGKYNHAKIGFCKPGRVFSDEHKEKLSKSAKGKKRSKEHCKNLSKAMIENGTTKGKNHPRHKYFYVTPEGTFDSPAALENIGITLTRMKSWCINCDKKILKSVYEKSTYLQENYHRDIIGKTYRDIGFSILLSKDQMS
jgi:hypothetical protein